MTDDKSRGRLDIRLDPDLLDAVREARHQARAESLNAWVTEAITFYLAHLEQPFMPHHPATIDSTFCCACGEAWPCPDSAEKLAADEETN